MGCGCGSVQSLPVTTEYLLPDKKDCIEVNCKYTMQQFIDFREKLLCIKSKIATNDNNLNRYLGIVISAINYPTNLCYFYDELVLVELGLASYTEC
jgi:hypothetical protein